MKSDELQVPWQNPLHGYIARKRLRSRKREAPAFAVLPQDRILVTPLYRAVAVRESCVRHDVLTVISGRTFQLGDSIPAVDDEVVRFQLTAVRPRSVVLECEGHRFELKMGSPGVQDPQS